MTQIRARAVAVCQADGRVLVERGYDRVAAHRFYRAIGGHIDFGERAADAAAREWREEYGLTLEDPRLLGVVENLFTYEGRPGHEIVFVFEARVAEREVYERDEVIGVDTNGNRHEGVWVPLADLAEGGEIPLTPHGLLALLHRPESRAETTAGRPTWSVGRRTVRLVAGDPAGEPTGTCLTTRSAARRSRPGGPWGPAPGRTPRAGPAKGT